MYFLSMVCDICGAAEALVFVQQVSGNQTVDLHLCPDCARSRGISTQGGKIEFSVAGLLQGLFDQKSAQNRDCPPCPSCGCTLEEMQKTGRLGCNRCYFAFQREIHVLLRRHAPVVQHRGKYPKRILDESTVLADREGLKDRLKKAIQDEDYEAAAGIRDRLKALDSLSGEA